MVAHSAAAGFDLTTELITDTAGHLLTGGSGNSGWGYNQHNLVRHGPHVYALSWRDDLTLAVFRRVGEGEWEEGAVLPPVPQNGNLLVDSAGRLHVIGGAEASWHVIFDEPGTLETWELRRRVRADSRFGACIDEHDQIFVAGGLSHLGWYLLDREGGTAAEGRLPHPRERGYQFTALRDGGAHTICSDDYFLPGDHFPNQIVTMPDPATGGTKDIETPHGIYPVMRAYYYHNPHVKEQPDDWRCVQIADVSDTLDEATGQRGNLDHQELMIDRKGLVHILFFENRQLSGAVWAGSEQDAANSRLFHSVGPAGGPFETWCLGSYNSGRLYETLDGRMHYLLTRGMRGSAESVWHAVSEPGVWGTISAPAQLPGCGPLHHLFISSPRAGGSCEAEIDLYWTGAPRPPDPAVAACSEQVWYARLTPKPRALL